MFAQIPALKKRADMDASVRSLFFITALPVWPVGLASLPFLFSFQSCVFCSNHLKICMMVSCFCACDFRSRKCALVALLEARWHPASCIAALLADSVNFGEPFRNCRHCCECLGQSYQHGQHRSYFVLQSDFEILSPVQWKHLLLLERNC